MNIQFYQQMKKTLTLVYVLMVANAVNSFGQLSFSRSDIKVANITTLGAYGIAIGDLNKDGKNELVVTNNLAGGISVLTNSRANAFKIDP
jgi:hypothetical protein